MDTLYLVSGAEIFTKLTGGEIFEFYSPPSLSKIKSFYELDTLHWLDRFARQGRTFDAIVLDPPTFSRDEKGKIWRVEKDYGKLVAKAMACLAPGGGDALHHQLPQSFHGRFP